MTPMAQNTINQAAKLARKVLVELKPALDQLNVLYDAEDGLKKTITDADLPGDATWSGLTKKQLDDSMWVLTATLRNALTDGYAALAQLAGRADN